MPRAPGRVILVIGPSCAGKSTLARAIQAAAEEPYLLLSLDGLFATIDDRWGGSGPLRDEGFAYAHDPGGVVRIVYGETGGRMLSGARRAVAAYARAGVNVVFDDMLLDATAVPDWADALDGLDALLVRLTAPREVLLAREEARTVHRTPGLAMGHMALHDAIAADLVIDTDTTAPEAAATLVFQRQANPSRVLSR